MRGAAAGQAGGVPSYFECRSPFLCDVSKFQFLQMKNVDNNSSSVIGLPKAEKR